MHDCDFFSSEEVTLRPQPMALPVVAGRANPDFDCRDYSARRETKSLNPFHLNSRLGDKLHMPRTKRSGAFMVVLAIIAVTLTCTSAAAQSSYVILRSEEHTSELQSHSFISYA